MVGKIYRFLASLDLSLWLTFGVMLLLAIGSFAGGETSSINEMPLFIWLQEAPFRLSWWLWGTLLLLAFLVVNTIFCSVESLRAKAGMSRFLIMISPQVMHLGFLLIVLAHLLSARGSFKHGVDAAEGTSIAFPGNGSVQVERISYTVGKMGMLTAFAADVRTGEGKGATLSPNNPFFYRGFGIYLKHVEPYPYPSAYLEVHKEPGAGAALAGALLFTVGNVILLAVRRGR